MNKTKANAYEFSFYVFAFLLVNVLSAHFQSPISFNEGRGWDGDHYNRIAEQFINGEPIQGDAPFCYRVGTPIVASLLKRADVLTGFKAVNLAANILTFVLFVCWIRLFINDRRIRCLLAFLVLAQWLAPFRMSYYYPVSTDNVMYAFLVLGWLCIYLARSKPAVGAACLGLVVFFGVLFRESLLVLALIFPFVQNPIVFTGLLNNLVTFQFSKIVRMPRFVFLLPLVAGCLGVVLTHRIAHKVNDYSFVHSALNWIYDKSWLTYIHGLFIAFGPVVVLVFYNWRRSCEFLIANQAFLAFMVGSCLLAYIGGSDTERFWYWTMPVTYVLIGRSIEDLKPLLRSKGFILLLCASQVIAARIFWTLPDFPNIHKTSLPVLTVVGGEFQFLDLYSYHGKKIIEAVSLAEYGLLAFVLIWWIHYRSVRNLPAKFQKPAQPGTI